MKLKHNKKRNTAFLYEVLVRSLTRAVLEQDKVLKQKIVSIFKEHFNTGTELRRQLDIYNSLGQSDNLHPFIAEKLVFEAKKVHDSLDQEKVFEQQSEVIRKINKLISKDAFNVFIPNYKSIASIYQIFDKNVPMKTRVIMEGKIIKNLIGGLEEAGSNMPPIDNLVFKSFVEKFNTKYGEGLFEEQKVLLSKYIVSFADNSSDLKIYLSEEIVRLREEVGLALAKEEISANESLQEKLNKVKGIIGNFQDVQINQKFIEQVLKIQSLIREI